MHASPWKKEKTKPNGVPFGFIFSFFCYYVKIEQDWLKRITHIETVTFPPVISFYFTIREKITVLFYVPPCVCYKLLSNCLKAVTALFGYLLADNGVVLFLKYILCAADGRG